MDRTLLIMVGGLGVGCADPPPLLPGQAWVAGAQPPAPLEPPPDPSDAEPSACAEPASWASTGHPFVLTYCTACHAETLPTGRRFGAPTGIDFDTPEGVRAWSERIRARVVDGTMPAGGGPSEAELGCFLAWLDAGALADSGGLPRISEASHTGVLAWEVEESVEALEPGLVVLVSRLVGIGHDTRSGVWSEETWQVTNTDGWLVGRDRFMESGDRLFSDTWTPPLPFAPFPADSWSVETERLRVHADGAETITPEVWDFSVEGAPDDVDARATDRAPIRIVAVERTTGAEVGLDLSPTAVFPRRWFFDTSELADPEAELVDFLQLTPILPESLPDFPLVAGLEWSSRLYGAEP